MYIMKRYLFAIVIFILVACRTPEPKEDIVVPSYIEHEQKKFYLYTDKKSKPLIDRLLGFETQVSSFYGEFMMRIKSGENLSESNILKGKIIFDKTSGKVKIQLMEPFFGMIVTQVLTDSNMVKIKSAGQKLHTQPMGDIGILDPKTGKLIQIPFPVIYHSISYNFIKDFQTGQSYFSPEENRVLVKKETEVYQYVFLASGLDSLDYSSSNSKLKAIAQVDERKEDIFHPPIKISTRVKDTLTNKDTGLIEIKYTNVRKVDTVPLSEFQF
jgi:hypothetical protein